MVVYKVSNSVFSTIKTVDKAISKALNGDVIHIQPGNYTEKLTLQKNLQFVGTDYSNTKINGTLHIASGSSVQFQQLTFDLNSQLKIDGAALFEHCHFNGANVDLICETSSSNIKFIHCTFHDAREVAILANEQSELLIRNCKFHHNGRTHILAEKAKLLIEYSEFSNAQHAIWLKDASNCLTKQLHIHDHTGTQIVLQQATFADQNSDIQLGDGNGIFADNESVVNILGTTFRDHQLPHIWLRRSSLQATNCTFIRSNESAVMIQTHADASFEHCYFQQHHLASVKTVDYSRLNMEHCQIYHCEGYGVQIKNHSVANFTSTIFKHNSLAQLHIFQNSNASLKECHIQNGKHIGIHIEQHSSCSLLQSLVHHHPNTAMVVLNSELNCIESEVVNNKGNGILACDESQLQIDNSRFYDNGMPHVALKSNCVAHISYSRFIRNKAIYAIDNCQLQLEHIHISDGDSVQIELADSTKAQLEYCLIEKGNANAISILNNVSLQIHHCKLQLHKLPQLAINDSSLICKDSVIISGEHNGLIIENHSDAFIENCEIAHHQYPQLWIDEQSSVDIIQTKITNGKESDLYVQNKSAVYLEQCTIQNDVCPYNIQVINYSRIDVSRSQIVNLVGNIYYKENNSVVVQKLDELDYE